jgi:spore coat polysaccharide biosynthesis protein SpsF
MGSERLPGKVLRSLAGRPLLWHVIERARALKYADMVVLATSDRPGDDSTAAAAADWGVEVFRGSEGDVLDRFHRAAVSRDASLIYRVNGDNPLADPDLADLLYESYRESPCEYLWIEGAGIGLGAELMTRNALETAWEKATAPEDREHVTTYIRRGETGEVRKVEAPAGYPLPARFRLTVDTEADFELARRIYDELYRPDGIIRIDEVARLFAECPELLTG